MACWDAAAAALWRTPEPDCPARRKPRRAHLPDVKRHLWNSPAACCMVRHLIARSATLMLCPHCQYELDEENMRCNNCTAEYPSAGLAGIGARFRSFLIACGLVIISAGILRDCVLNHLPGGVDSAYMAPGSPQVRLSPRPNLKSPAVGDALTAWQNGEQSDLQNPASSVHRKR